MRLRNIKGAHDIIESCPNVLINPEKYKGQFQQVFGNDHPIEIEIGSGKGNFIINKAKQNPDINYIGIEKYASVLVKLVKKIDSDLPNLKVLCFDANFIGDIFDKEITKVYLNFSDPWPKKKHADRRLTSSIFLKKYDKIFKGNNIIEMKTDNASLFGYSLVSLSQMGYQFSFVSLNLHQEDVDNIKTEYEEKFSGLGFPIYKVVASRQINDKNNQKS